MAQHDYIISNQSGAAFRSDLNNALAAIVSQNSGASAPSTTYAYQFWADTTTGLLKIRNAANSAWIALRELDGTLTIEDGSASAPGLAFASDINTGLYRVGADTLAITTGGSERCRVDSSGRVGIGTTSVTNLLHLRSDSSSSVDHLYLQNRNGGANSGARIAFSNGAVDYGDSRYAYIGAVNTGASESGNQLVFATNANGASATEKVRIDSSGRLLVATSSSLSVNSITAGVQVHSTATNNGASVSIARFANDTSGSQLILGKSRNATVAAGTIVQNNDDLGQLVFNGDDGTDLNTAAARIQAFVDGTPGADDMPGRLVFSTTADGASSPTERLRITNQGILNLNGQRSGFATPMSGSGNVRVAAASGGGIAISTFDIQDYTAVQFVREVSGTAQQVGTITCSSSATAYNTSSDYRLKENVVALDDAVTRLKQIPVYRFNFIAEPDKTVDGFLAHEVQDVVPEAITGEKDEVDADGTPVYQGIDQSKLVPLLTAALQEAIGEIESLKARVAALEVQ